MTTITKHIGEGFGRGELYDILSGEINIEGIGLVDGGVITLGTTTTTAATKVTLEFDETTTGIGQFNMGSVSVPMVLNTNPGTTVVGGTINITHSAGDGDCTDLMGLYVKTHISGDGDSGLTSVPIGARAYVYDAAVDEVYGVQSHARHRGTATVSGSMFAGSFKLNLGTPSGAAGADDFTVTDNIGALWLIATAAQSDVDVSGNYVVAKVDVEGNCKGVDAVFDINNSGASTGTIFDISGGSATYLAKITGSTFVEEADVTSGKSCIRGVRCVFGSTVGLIPFYED